MNTDGMPNQRALWQAILAEHTDQNPLMLDDRQYQKVVRILNRGRFGWVRRELYRALAL